MRSTDALPKVTIAMIESASVSVPHSSDTPKTAAPIAPAAAP